MSYLDSIVARGERIRLKHRQHPAGIARRVLIRGAQLMALLWLHTAATAPWIAEALAWAPLREMGLDVWLAPIPGYFQSACSLLMLAVVALTIGDGLRWHFSVYALTDERAMIVHGAITRVVLEIPFDKIEELALSQGPLGRLLGYGDILLRTGAAGGPRVLEDVTAAVEFKHALERLRKGRARDQVTTSRREQRSGVELHG